MHSVGGEGGDRKKTASIRLFPGKYLVPVKWGFLIQNWYFKCFEESFWLDAYRTPTESSK